MRGSSCFACSITHADTNSGPCLHSQCREKRSPLSLSRSGPPETSSHNKVLHGSNADARAHKGEVIGRSCNPEVTTAGRVYIRIRVASFVSGEANDEPNCGNRELHTCYDYMYTSAMIGFPRVRRAKERSFGRGRCHLSKA